ncbi:hypothetical protein D3C71_23120 [compost metagenome]
MLAFLFIFLALAFGLMAFVSMQDDIPEELGFLKSAASSVTQPKGHPPPSALTRLEGWTIVQSGPVIEATRQFSGEIVVKGVRYDVPTLGVLCNAGKLDARIEARHQLAAGEPLQVSLDGAQQTWARGGGTNVFPPAPVEFVRYLSGKPKVSVSLPFADFGRQTVTVDTSLLKDVLRALPASCR